MCKYKIGADKRIQECDHTSFSKCVHLSLSLPCGSRAEVDMSMFLVMGEGDIERASDSVDAEFGLLLLSRATAVDNTLL